jgi:hypothetical protein
MFPYLFSLFLFRYYYWFLFFSSLALMKSLFNGITQDFENLLLYHFSYVITRQEIEICHNHILCPIISYVTGMRQWEANQQEWKQIRCSWKYFSFSKINCKGFVVVSFKESCYIINFNDNWLLILQSGFVTIFIHWTSTFPAVECYLILIA